MALALFVAFVLVPILELAVILQVGSYLGAWPTVALLVVDSLAGAWLVRREGRRAWDAFRRALSDGRWPGDEVAQGALVLVGGALLLTPGFVTDAAGLLCVLPPTRALASRAIRAWLTPEPVKRATRLFERKEGRSPRGRDNGTPGPLRDRPGRRRGAEDDVIDVEVVSIEPDGRGPDTAAGTDEADDRAAGDAGAGTDEPDADERAADESDGRDS